MLLSAINKTEKAKKTFSIRVIDRLFKDKFNFSSNTNDMLTT